MRARKHAATPCKIKFIMMASSPRQERPHAAIGVVAAARPVFRLPIRRCCQTYGGKVTSRFHSSPFRRRQKRAAYQSAAARRFTPRLLAAMAAVAKRCDCFTLIGRRHWLMILPRRINMMAAHTTQGADAAKRKPGAGRP